VKTSLRLTFWKVTAHYAVLICAIGLLVAEAPGLAQYMPVGKAKEMFSSPAGPSLDLMSTSSSAPHADRLREASMTGRLVFLGLSFVCSSFAMIPVVLVYMGTSSLKKPKPLLVRTIVLLPITVTGLVLIVQNNIALAFSLAGVVAGAGMRFRMQLKAMTDMLYFLIAVGVGLASGVGSLGLAVMMSLVFSYGMLLVEAVNLGGVVTKEPKKEKVPTGMGAENVADKS
jgi:hypothetical protein